MEGAKEKAILALDYDDDDSSDEEEDEEIFDNSKVDWRVKGILLRGKEFSVSDNGNCPRCQSNVIVFVILDELFPMGDMPEILYNLLAKGKAVLWSSQDKHSCKKSPTFMCRGFCPPDPLGAGFNINWDTVNLTKLLKDLLRLNIAKAQKMLQESEKVNENEGEDDDVNEKDIIKAMLAQEQKKEDTEEPVHGPFKENESPKETSPSGAVATTSTTSAESSTTPVTSPATTSSPTTAATYPVSKDGSCPHCGSTSVRYIILIKDSSKDIKLPPTLDKLLKLGKAFKMAKGANSPPSFQCCSCTYGFNLDWSKTNLKKIFNFETETTSSSTSTTTKATASSTAVSSTAYQTSTSYPATSYPTSSYGSYAYTQPPMGYPAPGPYGYPGPAPLMAQSATGMVPPPPMGGGMAPLPYGAPIPYAGAQLYPGMPPQPYGLAPPPGPFMGPPQPYPPPNQFGPTPQGNMLPPTFQPPPGGPSMFAMQPPNFHGRGIPPGTMPGSIPGVMPPVSVSSPNMMAGPRPLPGFLQGPGPIPMPGPGPIPMPGPMQGLALFPGNPQGPGNFPANMQVPGNMQAMPRLRVPKGPQTRRKKKWKGKWKGQQGQHANHENLELQEQWQHVDGESHEDNEGEEGTSEDQYDPEAATRFEELLNKIDENENEGDHEDEKPPGEETQAEFEVTAFSPGEKPADTSETIVKNEPEVKNEKTQASPSNVTTKPEPTSLSDLGKAPENNGETNVTSQAEDEGLETSPSPRTKASRGRKRAATGARKKTAAARNTRSKKAAEDAGELEDGIGNNNDTDGLTETADDIKKAKVDSEQSQGNADANESIKEETAEDIAPKRVTRARSLRQKK